MAEFSILIRTRVWMIAKTIRALGMLRIASFIFVIGCFLSGTFFLFFKVFSYLAGVEIIGIALMDRIIEMAFFVFFIMLLFSNVITSFSTFYNDRELDFLFALPVPPTAVYLTKLFENCLYASWATGVVALPLTLAYGLTVKAGLFFYPVMLVSLFIYLIIPAALASVLIFLILRIFPRLTPRDVVLLALLFICGMTFFYVKVNNPGLMKIFETESEQELLRFAANLTTIGGSYVPSTWLSNILKGWAVNSGQGFFYSLLLLFASLSAVVLAYLTAHVLYVQSWQLIGEHSSKKDRRRSLLIRPQPSITRTILFKDILTFLREPTQWVQLSVFLILLVVYIFSLRRTPIYFVLPLWRTIVGFANFAYVSFVLATLGVRFIFPTISLERRGIWLIGSSPCSFTRLVVVKYLFSLAVAVVVVEVLIIFSNIFIRTDPRIYFVMPVIAVFLAGSLVSINLGLGGIFPQFNEDNPSRIAAGSGGIIAALASIAQVVISIILLATPAYNYLTNRYFNRPTNYLLIYSSFVLFLFLNFLVIVLPLRAGIRSLRRRDF